MGMEKEMSYGRDYAYIPATSISSGTGLEVLPDLYYKTIQIVNLRFAGSPEAKELVRWKYFGVGSF